MRMTSKGRYAVTAMLDLALHQDGGPITLSAIAERQKISQTYLEQLFGRLRKAGLVESSRGAQGGYSLAKALPSISVADIVRAIDEPIDATSCAGAQNCRQGERCITHNLWMELNHVIDQFLSGVTLESLIKRGNA